MPADILDYFRNQQIIREVTEVQGDPRTIPDELFFLRNTPVLPATDREMMMRWRGTAVIADLIALDSRSTVYRMLEAATSTTEIPKLKFGTYMMESELRQVLELGQAQLNATGRVPDFVRRLFRLLMRQLVIGRRWRLETMLVGSILNGFNYDRMGIKMAGTFGKNADTIVTPTPAWTDVVNGKPITNIRTMMDYMATKYGKRLNRWISSRAAFDTMTATDEFRSESESALLSLFTLTTLPVGNREQRIDAFKRITRIEEVVFYDTHYRWEDVNATTHFRERHLQRLLPINAVILDATENDNNEDVRYLGNAGVTESALIGRTGAQEVAEGEGADFGAMREGPFYYTVIDPKLDPAHVQAYAVQHAWPIRRDPNAEVVFYVGTIAEPIAIDDSIFSGSI